MSARRCRIAVCFFGITRSLAYTLPSIEKAVLAPAHATGETRLFGHFFRQTRIESPRTGEAVEVDPDEHRLLPLDAVELEVPGACLETWSFDEIQTYGDFWSNDFHTVRNLVHQLHSIRRVTLMALDWEPDIVLFVRPDLYYFDSFARPLGRLARRPAPLCMLPYWHGWGGYNDRFALVRGRSCIRRYGLRAERALAFCRSGPRYLHPERLLHFAMRGRPVRRVALRAARIRAHGRPDDKEAFDLSTVSHLHEQVWYSNAPQRVKDGLHKGLNVFQDGVDYALYGRRAKPLRGFSAERVDHPPGDG